MDVKAYTGSVWFRTGMAWTHLAQDRDKWWAAVNMVMNLQVP